MDLESRNQEIRNLLDLWQWCSRTLHVQWERKRKYCNGCLFGLASAVNESQFGANVSPYQLPLVYRDLAEPLFNDLGLLAFWEEYPTLLLDMCLGCFTKSSPLIDRLNRFRLKRQDNPVLDKLFKRMRGHEERLNICLFEYSKRPNINQSRPEVAGNAGMLVQPTQNGGMYPMG